MRHILFDLDGTLIDSQPGIKTSVLHALRSLGHHPESSLDIRFMLGPPIAEGFSHLLKQYGDNRVEEAVQRYREHYKDQGLFKSELYPHIRKVLDHLKSTGQQLFIATSKRQIFAERILNELRLTHYFSAIQGSTDDGSLDNKSALIEWIIRQHDLNPTQTIMIGDRANDIVGARSNNLLSIGALWGYGDKDELVEAKADLLVTSPQELLTAIIATE